MRGRARSETQAAGRCHNAHASTLSSQLLRASRAYVYARVGVSWYQVACLDAIEMHVFACLHLLVHIACLDPIKLHVLHVLGEIVSRRRLSSL
jgi:hypothetical protein